MSKYIELINEERKKRGLPPIKSKTQKGENAEKVMDRKVKKQGEAQSKEESINDNPNK